MTNTDIAPAPQGAPPPARREAKAQIVSGAAVAAMVPTTIDEVFRLSQAIYLSGLQPGGFDTPEKITVAILTGAELGMKPMQALQSIAVINGRPCLWGDGLLAVVKASPLCLSVKEWIEGEEDSRVAYCQAARRDYPDTLTRMFSVADAKRAKLWSPEPRITRRTKDGSRTYEVENDSPWHRYPQRMLQMRARAWCLRDLFPDVLRGMQVREEVEDYTVDVTPVPAPVAAPAARVPLSARLGVSAAPAPTSGFSAEFVDAETTEPDRPAEPSPAPEEPEDDALWAEEPEETAAPADDAEEPAEAAAAPEDEKQTVLERIEAAFRGAATVEELDRLAQEWGPAASAAGVLTAARKARADRRKAILCKEGDR